jgi:hypothetical protein
MSWGSFVTGTSRSKAKKHLLYHFTLYVKEKPRDILNRWRSSAIQELIQKGEVVEAAKVLDIMKDYRTVEERERTSTSTTSLPNLPSTKNLGQWLYVNCK